MRQNSVQLIGYVGSDPVIKVFQNGVKRAEISVATHHKLRKEENGQKYGTTWHHVIAWDKLAEHAERSFVKGSRILITGIINYRTFSDSNNHTRYITEIRAEELINLDR